MSPDLDIDGQAVSLLRFDERAERVAIASARAFPPGTPLCAQICGSGQALQLKVVRCARQKDGCFEIEARLVNLSREKRRLLAMER